MRWEFYEQMDEMMMMVREMCGVQLKDGKRAKNVMLMLSLNEDIDQMAMANSVLVLSCIMERGWSSLEKGIRH